MSSGLLGSYVNPQGLRRSARLAEPISDDDNAILDALFEPSAMVMGGRRRRKYRGGAEDRYEAIVELAQSMGTSAANAIRTTRGLASSAARGARGLASSAASSVSSAASAVAGTDFYQQGIQPIVTTASGLGTRTKDLVYYTLLAGLSIIPLVLGAGTGAAGVFSRLAQNMKTFNDAITAGLVNKQNQDALADAISKDIPTAVVVAIAAATQAGLLSLTTVVAVILRAFGTALTGAGRAAATVGIYLWYVGKTPEQKTAINNAAKEYAVAAKDAAVETAGDVAAGAGVVATKAGALASAVAGGVAAAASKVASTAGAIRGAVGAGAAPAPTNAEVQAAATEMASTQTLDAAVGEAAVVVVAAAKSGTASSSASSADKSSEVSTNADAAEAEAVAPSRGTKRKGREEEPGAASAAVVPSATEGRAKVLKKAGGGRKTKKRSAKRRATRRRKAPKYLAAPVFAY